jgi:DNA-directed RNA polymerase subunit RPC12/RpoP
MKMLAVFSSLGPAIISISIGPAYARDIYINKATKRSIMKLEGAGKRIGDAIIEDRDMNGPYWSLEDLQRVGAGLGPKWRDRAGDKIIITPEYKCWQCGAVINLKHGEKEGICPYCKYEWPKRVFLQKKKKEAIDGKH